MTSDGKGKKKAYVKRESKEAVLQKVMESSKLFLDEVKAVRKLIMSTFRAEAAELRLAQDDFWELADGAVTDGMARAYAQAEKWDDERAGFRSWVFLNAKGFAANALRKLKIRAEANNQFCSQQRAEILGHSRSRKLDPFWQRPIGKHAQSILSRLTEAQRTVVVLHAYQDYTLTEIAQLMDLSETAVYGLHKRAKAALERAVEEMGARPRAPDPPPGKAAKLKTLVHFPRRPKP